MAASKAERTRLAAAKLALAQKYERLAKIAKSLPRRKKYINQCERFRRQAEMLSTEKD